MLHFLFVEKQQRKHAEIFIKPCLLKISFLTDQIDQSIKLTIDQISIHFPGFSSNAYEGLEFLQGELLII